MALPIAHATAGYLAHRLDPSREQRESWRRAVAFLLIGNLPDVDFLFGFVTGEPGAFHRGVTHTVLAMLVFAVAAGTVAWWRRLDAWWPAAALCGAAYASHLLVDAFTIDQRGPAGARFFWPFSDAYYISPVTIFGEILIDGGSRAGFVRSILQWPTVWVLLREVAIASVALGALRLFEAARRTRENLDATSDDARIVADVAGEEDLA